jgi:N-acetylglucosaminyl-diphospho-decaprenol L-rhamnosyltransferase
VDPTIDVVVVTYNSRHVVEDLLDSLPAALAGLPARTVVVDNGSTDGTRDLLAGRADCRLVPSDNDGYAAGVNRGVAALAGSGPILVLNPDVRLAAGSVRELVDALAVPGTAVTAPRVLNEDGTLFRSLRREPTIPRALGLSGTGRPWLSEAVAEPEAYETPHTVDWALGAALLVSRESHELLGGWDESFFLYSEETDFCLRARDRGLATRYVPTAVCTHIGGASGRSARLNTMQVLNRVRLYRRRHAAVASWAYFAIALAAELQRSVRGNTDSRDAVVSLLRPRRRPRELACAGSLLPS